MTRHDFQLADGISWTDVTAPGADDLTTVARELGLPEKQVLSARDPEYLPKFEMLGETVFVILRCVDIGAKKAADSIGDLTTKVVIFVTPKRVLTIHRLDPEFVSLLRGRAAAEPGRLPQPDLMRALIFGAVLTYDEPISALEQKIETLEADVFKGKRSGRLLREGFLIRRRGSIYRRALEFTADVIAKVAAQPACAWTDIGETRDRTARLVYYAEELVENVIALLNLHVALSSQKTNEASYRTNEIVRVLTVFSIFFLPLNFIAGIYGMNFDHIPELHWERGYYAVLALMGLVALAIFWYMRRHGWMTRVDD